MDGKPGSAGEHRPTGTAADDAMTPKDLKVKLSEQRLHVIWRDGTQSELPLALLRRNCPCATCRQERDTVASPLQILSSDPTELRAVDARLVGNYAIRFSWSDGHDSGMFPFRRLRELADAGSP